MFFSIICGGNINLWTIFLGRAKCSKCFLSINIDQSLDYLPQFRILLSWWSTDGNIIPSLNSYPTLKQNFDAYIGQAPPTPALWNVGMNYFNIDKRLLSDYHCKENQFKQCCLWEVWVSHCERLRKNENNCFGFSPPRSPPPFFQEVSDTTKCFLAVHNSSIGDLVPCLVCLLVRHH